MYITSPEPLRRLCAQAQTEGRLAIDLEFIRENTYAPQLALIQIAVGDTCAIVDPLSVDDLSPLVEALTTPGVLKVLHAAGQDVEVLHWHTGSLAEPIFDTQIAASMVGLGEQLSYGRLVDILLGVSLTKGESYSDWLRRPLLPSQTQYALDDVRYLLPLHDRLAKRLDGMGRAAWAADECRKFTDPALYERDPAHPLPPHPQRQEPVAAGVGYPARVGGMARRGSAATQPPARTRAQQRNPGGPGTPGRRRRAPTCNACAACRSGNWSARRTLSWRRCNADSRCPRRISRNRKIGTTA